MQRVQTGSVVMHRQYRAALAVPFCTGGAVLHGRPLEACRVCNVSKYIVVKNIFFERIIGDWKADTSMSIMHTGASAYGVIFLKSVTIGQTH